MPGAQSAVHIVIDQLMAPHINGTATSDMRNIG